MGLPPINFSASACTTGVEKKNGHTLVGPASASEESRREIHHQAILEAAKGIERKRNEIEQLKKHLEVVSMPKAYVHIKVVGNSSNADLSVGRVGAALIEATKEILQLALDEAKEDLERIRI
jgi:hypothetical protein